jgi:hypothetical protein
VSILLPSIGEKSLFQLKEEGSWFIVVERLAGEKQDDDRVCATEGKY